MLRSLLLLFDWLLAALLVVVLLGLLDRQVVAYHPAWFVACCVVLVVGYLWRRSLPARPK